MPWGMRIIDEKTLQDEIQKNPKSTRWVSKRGVMRKKQGNGKEKRNAVDESHVQEAHAGDVGEREMQQGAMQQRDMRAREMEALDTQAQEAQAREMQAQQMREREMRDREIRGRDMRDHHGFNRRPDRYHHGHDHEDEHNFDSQSYHRARPSRRPNSLDYPEVHFAPLRRSHPPSFSYSQPENKSQGPDNTRRPAPRFQSAKLPPKPQRKRESPTYKASQRPRAEPHPRSELPRQGQPSRRKEWTPPAANDVVADIDPMTGSGRTWDSRETWHATGNPDFW